MQTITYELRENGSARNYYKVTKQLAVELKRKMEIYEPHVRNFISYISENNIETIRSTDEYAIELLYFSVIFRWLRHRVGNDTHAVYQWLKEAGEFKEEVRRWKYWLDFFDCYEEEQRHALGKALMAVMKSLDEMGEKYLKQYIPNVNAFLHENESFWTTRKDAGLILRDSSCYYVNMIGSQILNQCYREDFKKCQKVYLFLPGCLAARGAECPASEEKDGYRCLACTETCQVRKLSETYPHVRIVYHGSQMEQKKVEEKKSIGVIGVACVLNLLSGGMKARRLGYIPQCVILNECGCSIHWSQEGIVTSLDEEELEGVMRKL